MLENSFCKGMAGETGDLATTVLTCEGNLRDPQFQCKLNYLIYKLKQLVSNGTRPFNVTKVEPWNSVRITFNIPREAALRLRQLAEQGDHALRDLGILSVQVEGDQITLSGRYNDTGQDFRPEASQHKMEGVKNAASRRNSQLPAAAGSTGLYGGGAKGSGHLAKSAEFCSPNVVAPSTTEPLPFASDPSRQPASTSFSPFPFASMTHAAMSTTKHGSPSTSRFPFPSSSRTSPSSSTILSNAQPTTTTTIVQKASSPGTRSPSALLNNLHSSSSLFVTSPGGKGVSLSSPLLVNLLQSGDSPNKMMPPPVSNNPVKRRRKTKKPKETVAEALSPEAAASQVLAGSARGVKSGLGSRKDSLCSSKTKHLVNPFTGQLEPMSSDEEDDPFSFDLHHSSLSSGKSTAIWDNAHPRLNDVLARGLNDSSSGEKLKLRLKLDSKSMKEGGESLKRGGSKVEVCSSNKPDPVKRSKPQEPRVPPLHISLRGPNAAVVVSPRKDDVWTRREGLENTDMQKQPLSLVQKKPRAFRTSANTLSNRSGKPQVENCLDSAHKEEFQPLQLSEGPKEPGQVVPLPETNGTAIEDLTVHSKECFSQARPPESPIAAETSSKAEASPTTEVIPETPEPLNSLKEVRSPETNGCPQPMEVCPDHGTEVEDVKVEPMEVEELVPESDKSREPEESTRQDAPEQCPKVEQVLCESEAKCEMPDSSLVPETAESSQATLEEGPEVAREEQAQVKAEDPAMMPEVAQAAIAEDSPMDQDKTEIPVVAEEPPRDLAPEVKDIAEESPPGELHLDTSTLLFRGLIAPPTGGETPESTSSQEAGGGMKGEELLEEGFPCHTLETPPDSGGPDFSLDDSKDPDTSPPTFPNKIELPTPPNSLPADTPLPESSELLPFSLLDPGSIPLEVQEKTAQILSCLAEAPNHHSLKSLGADNPIVEVPSSLLTTAKVEPSPPPMLRHNDIHTQKDLVVVKPRQPETPQEEDFPSTSAPSNDQGTSQETLALISSPAQAPSNVVGESSAVSAEAGNGSKGVMLPCSSLRGPAGNAVRLILRGNSPPSSSSTTGLVLSPTKAIKLVTLPPGGLAMHSALLAPIRRRRLLVTGADGGQVFVKVAPQPAADCDTTTDPTTTIRPPHLVYSKPSKRKSPETAAGVEPAAEEDNNNTGVKKEEVANNCDGEDSFSEDDLTLSELVEASRSKLSVKEFVQTLLKDEPLLVGRRRGSGVRCRAPRKPAAEHKRVTTPAVVEKTSQPSQQDGFCDGVDTRSPSRNKKAKDPDPWPCKEEISDLSALSKRKLRGTGLLEPQEPVAKRRRCPAKDR